MKKIILLFLFSGFLFFGALGASLFYAKFKIESAAFWSEVEQQSGLKLSAARQSFTFFPRIHLEFDNLKMPGKFQASKVSLTIAWQDLIKRQLSVNLSIKDPVIIATTAVNENTDSKASHSNTKLPEIPFLKKISLEINVNNIKTNKISLPMPVNLKSSIAVELEDDHIQLNINKFQTIGIFLNGKARVNDLANINFDFILPAGESILVAKASGALVNQKLELQAQFSLPELKIPFGNSREFLLPMKEGGVRKITISGDSSVAAVGAINLQDKNWQAKVDWRLNLDQNKIKYLNYEKTAGMPLSAKGKFNGNATKWEMKGFVAKFMNAVVDANIQSERDLRLQANVEPFNLANWVPLVKKYAKKDFQLKGILQSNIDISVGDKGVTGRVKAKASNVVVESALVAPMLENKDLKLDGPIKIDSDIEVGLRDNAWKGGRLNFIADVSHFAFVYKDLFQKNKSRKKGVWQLAFNGVAEGKDLSIRSVQLIGPQKLKLFANGSIKENLIADLTFKNTKIPLSLVSSMTPKLEKATGNIMLSGKLKGILNKPDTMNMSMSSFFQKVSLQQKDLQLRNLQGKAVLGYKNEEIRLIAKKQIAFNIKTKKTPKPLNMSIRGASTWNNKAKIIRGNYLVGSSAINFEPFLSGSKTKKEESASEATKVDLAKMAQSIPLDLFRSALKLEFKSPKINGANLDFAQAKLKMIIGQDQKTENPEIWLQNLSGKSLEGTLVLNSKLYLLKNQITFTSNAQSISLKKLNGLMADFYGKEMPASFFGYGNLQSTGTVAVLKGFNGIDMKGKLDIRKGGFTFLPVSKKLWDKLRKNKTIGSKLKDPKGLTESLQSANARFHIHDSRMDLNVEAKDQFMRFISSGFVTMAGHCEMQGNIYPTQKLLGQGGMNLLAGDPVPFESKGDNWQCSVSPILDDFAVKVAKREAKKAVNNEIKKQKEKLQLETKEKVKEKAKEKAKKMFKSIFK